jgi:hypothetical protein
MNTQTNALHAYPRQWIKTVAATGTPERLTQISLSMSIAGATPVTENGRSYSTATTSVAHQLQPGDEFQVTGLATRTELNSRRLRVWEVTSATEFVFVDPSGDEDNEASVAVVLTAFISFERATVLGKKAARTANTGDVYLGLSSTNDTQPYKIATDTEIVIEAPPGKYMRLADWYVDVATAADGVVVLFF